MLGRVATTLSAHIYDDLMPIVILPENSNNKFLNEQCFWVHLKMQVLLV